MLASPITRRRWLSIAGTAAGAWALAGCSPPLPQSSGAQPGQAAGTPAPRRGGSIRIGQVIDVTNLDPATLQQQDYPTKFAVFDRLIQYDDNVTPQPMLAESFQLSPDAQQLRLKLRQGVQFHTGRELTSDDVKFTLLRLKDPKVGIGQLATMGAWVSDVSTPDKYSVVIQMDRARPAIFDLLEYLHIADAQSLQGPDAASTMIGTGAFKFDSWLPGDHMRLVRNENYWQPGVPYADEWLVMVVKDPQALQAQLEAGAVDIVDLAAVSDAVRLKDDKNFHVVPNPNAGNYWAIIANTGVPPLDDKRVRQALNYAINRQRIVDVVFQGTTQAQDLVWPQGSPAYEAAKTNLYTFDLNKATMLLQDAGVSNLEFDGIYGADNPNEAGIMQIFQSDLAQIGVTLTLRPLDAAARSAATNNAQYRGVSAYQGTFAQLEPSTIFVITIAWNPSRNAAAFKNDQYTQLVDAVTTEADASRRRQLYSNLNDFVLDQSFIMLISRAYASSIAGAKVQGLHYDLSGGTVARDAWLSA